MLRYILLIVLLPTTIISFAQDDLYGGKEKKTKSGRCKFVQNELDRFTGLKTVKVRAGQITLTNEGGFYYFEATIDVINLVGNSRNLIIRKDDPFYVAFGDGGSLKLNAVGDSEQIAGSLSVVIIVRCALTREQFQYFLNSPVIAYRAKVEGQISGRQTEKEFTTQTINKSVSAAECVRDVVESQ